MGHFMGPGVPGQQVLISSAGKGRWKDLRPTVASSQVREVARQRLGAQAVTPEGSKGQGCDVGLV